MPVTITKSASAHAKAFFQALGGQPLEMFQALRGKGITVEVETQSLQVKHPGYTFGAIILPVASSAVVKGFTPSSLKPALVTKIAKYLAACIEALAQPGTVVVGDIPSQDTPPVTAPAKGVSVYFDAEGNLAAVGGKPPTKPLGSKIVDQLMEEMATKEIKPSLKFFDMAKAADEALETSTKTETVSFGSFQNLPKPMYNPIPGAFEPTVDLEKPVPLKDAVALNQAVKGTSDSSVYRVVAIGPRIRMAARVKGGQLSVRVEGPVNSSEAQALTTLGFKSGTGYRSNHYNLSGTGIPPERVIGAIFLTEGLELTQMVKKMSEVKDGA